MKTIKAEHNPLSWRNFVPKNRLVLWICSATLILNLMGCGDGLATYPVQGKVQFANLLPSDKPVLLWLWAPH